jgi:hypothetical protein
MASAGKTRLDSSTRPGTSVHMNVGQDMAVHAPMPAHCLCPPKCTRMLQDVLNIQFRLFPSPHSGFRRGKVDFRDFVSIFGQNDGH